MSYSTSTNMSCKTDQPKWNGMVILRSTSNSWSQLYSRRLKSLFLIKSTGAASNRPYWRNNHGVLLARRTYNVALKKYRRNPLPELHGDLQEAHNSCAEVCRLVRNHLGTSGSQRSIQLLMSETCGDVLDQHQEQRHDLQLIRSPIWKQRDSVWSSQIDPVHRTYHCRLSSSWLM